jgi:hypothetical protein
MALCTTKPCLTKPRPLIGLLLACLLSLLLSVGCLGTPPQRKSQTAIPGIAAEQGTVAAQGTAAMPDAAAALGSVNVGVVEIPDVSGFRQVVAVSDPHGMFAPLTRLLSACKLITPAGHWLAERTLLIVVGDSIDKGPQSLEILDLWRTLSLEAPQQNSRIVVLLGNHEAEFLADPTRKKSAATREELEAKGLAVRDLLDPNSPRGRFLRAMPLAARVGKRWLFCHAGWVPDMPYPAFVAKAQSVLRAADYANDFLLNPDSILEKRDGGDGGKWWENPADVRELTVRLDRDGLYGVVFGHQPAAFGLEGAIGPYDPKDARLIKIDSGMAPDAGGHPGHLLLFTVPEELTHNTRPAHLFSSGFDDGHSELRTRPL